jgi:hypothetical protein
MTGAVISLSPEGGIHDQHVKWAVTQGVECVLGQWTCICGI